MRYALHLAAAVLLCAASAVAGDDAPQSKRAPSASKTKAPATQGPLAPEDSRRAIRVPEGFTVELVAAEPLVVDPVAFDWAPDGRLWVAEMRDYPTGLDDEGTPTGTVRLLTDDDGDSRYDRATVFLDKLSFPSGVKAWRNGVLVAAAPDIIYAEDTDGDGRADVRKVLYHGFGEGNPQHRVNGLTPGLDNWLYCANGDSGGLIESIATGDKLPISFRDFRIRPDDGALDLLIGHSQFTRVRDDWGNWFGSSNADPMYQFLLEDRYVRRNRYVAPSTVQVDVSTTPGAAPVYPIGLQRPLMNDVTPPNHFTSACSAIVYRDELFGPAFVGNSFVSEPAHNLVHREVMTRDGVRFSSHRPDDEQHSEFLASTDTWFRPTTIRTGPGGALWIADMYRAVIEHPEYIPAERRAGIDFRAGDTMGRIYRVYPTENKPRPIVRLDRLDSAGLVAALDTPNGTQRDAAQQLLVEQRNPAAIAPLNKMFETAERPLTRLHALCTLDGLDAIDEATLLVGLCDTDGGVRRHAVRLAEPWLARSVDVADLALTLVNDSDPQVRLQLACSLGAWDDPRSGAALGRLTLLDASNPDISAAVMTSVGTAQLDGVVTALLAAISQGPPPPELLQNVLAVATAVDDSRPLVRLLGAISTPHEGKFAQWQFAAVAGMLDTLDRRNSSLTKLRAKLDGAGQAAVDRLAPLFTQARAVVGDEQIALDARLAAFGLLGRGLERHEADAVSLARFLQPRFGSALRAEAAEALAALDDPRAPTLLTTPWKSYSPRERAAVIELLLRRPAGATALVEAVERGDIPPAEIDAAHRHQLTESPNAALRARAEKLFAAARPTDRTAVIDRYRAALAAPGDSRRGQAVFKQHCAACHRAGGIGSSVGPELVSLADRSTDALLVAVFDPNRAVESKYTSYTAVTAGGKTFTGMLTAETGSSITLVSAEGKETTILRADLDALESSGRSFMPEGLEKVITPANFADLAAFLAEQSGRPAVGSRQ